MTTIDQNTEEISKEGASVEGASVEAAQIIPEIYQRFGHSVRTVRRAKNITQAQLAKAAGMNKTYLVRIESGDKNVTLKTAQKIALALDMDLVVLLKGVKITVV
ncbi:MAG: helix-turn-helix transcriptional regulator [Chloroflexota bacterium]